VEKFTRRNGRFAAYPYAGRTSPEAVATRLEAYRNQTAPILPYYRARDILRPVDGMAEIDEVTRQIETVLRDSKAAGMRT